MRSIPDILISALEVGLEGVPETLEAEGYPPVDDDECELIEVSGYGESVAARSIVINGQTFDILIRPSHLG